FLLFVPLLCSCSVYFFLQAEDGIRDLYVTGVQTCALPISRPAASLCSAGRDPCLQNRSRLSDTVAHLGLQPCACPLGSGRVGCRSEERRVGKECWCRGWS